ncbi:unnamed protein product [Amoebophrya sp. A120]|nr:unnamed protein product [Amoebophrya sp. A120]|eukprot:GSA120T00018310001.1
MKFQHVVAQDQASTTVEASSTSTSPSSSREGLLDQDTVSSFTQDKVDDDALGGGRTTERQAALADENEASLAFLQQDLHLDPPSRRSKASTQTGGRLHRTMVSGDYYNASNEDINVPSPPSASCSSSHGTRTTAHHYTTSFVEDTTQSWSEERTDAEVVVPAPTSALLGIGPQGGEQPGEGDVAVAATEASSSLSSVKQQLADLAAVVATQQAAVARLEKENEELRTRVAEGEEVVNAVRVKTDQGFEVVRDLLALVEVVTQWIVTYLLALTRLDYTFTAVFLCCSYGAVLIGLAVPMARWVRGRRSAPPGPPENLEPRGRQREGSA